MTEMLKRSFFRALLLLLPLMGMGTVQATPELLYFVDVCRFYSTEGNPYAEIYLNLEAPTLYYAQNANTKWSGSVVVNYEIRRVESSGAPVWERKIELSSGDVADTSQKSLSFGIMDVRRVSLEPGQYTLSGTLRDLNDPRGRVHKFERELLIEGQSLLTCLSDVEFIQSFKRTSQENAVSKLGYDIMPLITNASFIEMDTLRFYTELYNSDKEATKAVFVSAYISRANSVEKIDLFYQTIKKTPKPFDILQVNFDISKLPSQTYYLNLEVYNEANKLLATKREKIFVYNSSVQNDPSLEIVPIEGDFNQHFTLSEQELNEYIPTLQYISTATELDFAKGLKTLLEKQNYFYNFWLKRRKDPSNEVALEWKNYEARVKYANEHYKSVYLAGWKTDRGRVLLTYGPPNDQERFFYENNSYPYEIWRYNKINTQAGVIFVFYDPDRATEDWPLLHSDKLGERNNPRWRMELQARTAQEGNLDMNDPRTTFPTPGRQ